MASDLTRGATHDSRRPSAGAASDRGFMMVAILIGMAVAAIMMTAALPKWHQQVQRTREEELIFRGEQYARAIVLFWVKNNRTYPPSIDVLVSQHYLRKKWKDPVTNDDFALVGTGIINLPGAGQSTPVGGHDPCYCRILAGRRRARRPGRRGWRRGRPARDHRRAQQEHRDVDQGLSAATAVQPVAIRRGAHRRQDGRQSDARSRAKAAGRAVRASSRAEPAAARVASAALARAAAVGRRARVEPVAAARRRQRHRPPRVSDGDVAESDERSEAGQRQVRGERSEVRGEERTDAGPPFFLKSRTLNRCKACRSSRGFRVRPSSKRKVDPRQFAPHL